jgi:hypothetical protein
MGSGDVSLFIAAALYFGQIQEPAGLAAAAIAVPRSQQPRLVESITDE